MLPSFPSFARGQAGGRTPPPPPGALLTRRGRRGLPRGPLPVPVVQAETAHSYANGPRRQSAGRAAGCTTSHDEVRAVPRAVRVQR